MFTCKRLKAHLNVVYVLCSVPHHDVEVDVFADLF